MCSAGLLDDDANAAFQQLARSAGVIAPRGPPALALRTGAFGRGLFAARDLAPGEPLLSVPLGLCLAAEREAAVCVPGGAWATLMAGRVPGWPRLQTGWEAYPLPWDVRLALCFLDALDGCAGAEGSAAADKWRAYGALLPAPDSVSNPVALPTLALAAAQQPALQEEWAADASRIAALCPALAVPVGDDATLPSPLHYGVALARSRAFGAGDVFLICPFVDMTNTTFGAANAVAALRVPPGGTAADALLSASGSFDLSVAPGAGIAAGTEVFISYGAGAAVNASLLGRYGFVRDNNPNERVPLAALAQAAAGEDAPAPMVDAEAVERAASAACAAAGGKWLRERSTNGQLIAALASLPARPRSARPRAPQEELVDVEALRAGIAAALATCPTSPEVRVARSAVCGS